jgi:glucose/mannose-6-phosphate isomerase
MIDLDDIETVKQYDKSSQIDIMINWHSYIKDAREHSMKLDISTSYQWNKKKIEFRKPKSIIVCGMGGSAIAGDYLSQLFKNDLSIPVIINRDYDIPQFVDENTLVICISYSGNTEETLSSFYKALLKGAMIITISSSGYLETFSKQIGIPHIKIKEGLPPRTAFPLIYVTLISILERFELIKNMNQDINETEQLLQNLAQEYSLEKTINDNLPKQISLGLFNTLPVFVGHTFYSSVAFRAKSELNENSKILAICEELPEQNHNGIVVVDNPNKTLNDTVFVFFRDKEESKSIKIRIEETIKLISKKTEKILEVYPKGKSKLARQFSSTYLIDFVSIYLAILYEIDPSITPSIDSLKAQISKKVNIVDKIKGEINSKL